MWKLIVLSAASLLTVSGCSTTPSPARPVEPIPESKLVRCQDLPPSPSPLFPNVVQSSIHAFGKYYECQSRMDELIQAVRDRQK